MRIKARYTIFSVVGIVLAAGLIGYGIWSAVGLRIPMEKTNVSDIAETTEKAVGVPFTAMDRVSVSGVWDLEIRQGEQSFSVFTDTEKLSGLKVEESGGVLHIENASQGLDVLRPIRAILILPALKSFEIEGASKVVISGIESNDMSVKVVGMGSLTIVDSHFENLVIGLEGAAGIDTAASSAVNVTVDLQGTGSAKIHMAGGVLSGTVEGLGNLEYSGTVTEERIDRKGPFFAVNHAGEQNE